MISQFVIESFSNGVDLRRSADTAPPGSLRRCQNAFINEGGEIEKRKAFVMNTDLTTYAQSANYGNRVTGPHSVPGDQTAVYYRHRHNSLPGAPFAAGAGAVAQFLELSGDADRPVTAWVMKSTIAATGLGALFQAASVNEFGVNGHLFEVWRVAAGNRKFQHVEVEFSGSEPIADTQISANDERDFQLILRDKGYVVNNNTMRASAVGDPGDMAGAGSGSIDVRSQSKPIGLMKGIGEYFGQLVLFGERGAQFWEVDADFAQNQYLRSIQLSIISGQSITSYADGDVLYLAQNGIRSLQARDASNFAHVSDVGSPIDKQVQQEFNYANSALETILGTSRKNGAFHGHTGHGIVHPQTGQFWLFAKDTVFVLSNYPASKVRAWSTFKLPVPLSTDSDIGAIKGRWCADVCQIREDLIYRNFRDETYLYGGPGSSTYDTTEAEIVTPHMDMGRPGTEKVIWGIDIACSGTWTIEVSLIAGDDPDALTWEMLATVTNSTHHLARIGCNLTATHLALRLKSTSASAARIGQITVFYNTGGEK